MPVGWFTGVWGQQTPVLPKIGRPKRDRGKVKASRRANRARRR